MKNIKNWKKFNESTENIDVELANEILDPEQARKPSAIKDNMDLILNNPDFLRYLMDNGLYNISTRKVGMIYRYLAKNNSMQTLKILADEYPDTLRDRETGRDQALRFAAEFGRFDMVEYLLDLGVFNESDKERAIRWITHSDRAESFRDEMIQLLSK